MRRAGAARCGTVPGSAERARRGRAGPRGRARHRRSGGPPRRAGGVCAGRAQVGRRVSVRERGGDGGGVEAVIPMSLLLCCCVVCWIESDTGRTDDDERVTCRRHRWPSSSPTVRRRRRRRRRPLQQAVCTGPRLKERPSRPTLGIHFAPVRSPPDRPAPPSRTGPARTVGTVIRPAEQCSANIALHHNLDRLARIDFCPATSRSVTDRTLTGLITRAIRDA
ncbi:hypothetical protein FA95DRAFT_671653 [Auriscalpium vulgare]|uniref:Uncharacterized protein n=1 Tax=Auriscalpium vulgare TaxID=40419 RepID=A0ACB8RCK5_9AGAM|nr:hypothetical protein FA95DRAFT_671653 [Auriscalpium vulgare]